MITVGKLIELLSVYSKDSRVTDESNKDIIHIVNLNDADHVLLSSTKPIGICNRCGNYVYPCQSDSEHNYSGYCPSHDEDLFAHEMGPLDEEDDAEEDI